MKRGFLANDVNFIINKDLFLKHHFNIYIGRNRKQVIRGYDVGISSSNKHIIGTIGEFFEREILINSNPLRKNMLQTICLNDGRFSRNVSTSNIVFTDKFIDSCGMSSHVDSEKAIYNGLTEYFERQSLIASYLYELPATKIKLTKNKKVHEYLLNYLNKISYFNISLIDEIYVVIAIGTGIYKAVGLGTSMNIEKAIEKAQRELLQYFASSMSKYGHKILTKKIFFLEEDKDYYEQNFEKINSQELLELYSYLYNYKTVITDNSSGVVEKKSDFYIKKMGDHLNMKPEVVLIPSFRTTFNLKVIKVVDRNWFPHMNPKLYDPAILNYTMKTLAIRSADLSKKNWIPFP